MLDLLGKKYVIDHCVMYLDVRSREEVLRVYITDALKAIANNTGRMVKDGVTMSKRFADLFVSHDTDEKDSEQKANEIKDRIKSRLEKLGRKGG